MHWLVYAALSAVFAGLVPIFGKVGVQGLDSPLAITPRAAIMFGMLLAVVLVRGQLLHLAALDRRTLLFIILPGWPVRRRGCVIFVRCSWAMPCGWHPLIA